MSRRQIVLETLNSPRTGTLDAEMDWNNQNHDEIPQQQNPTTPTYKQPLTPGGSNRQQERRKSSSKTITPVIMTEWSEEDFERQYDLTPVALQKGLVRRKVPTPSYTVDPFEFSPCGTPVSESNVSSPQNTETSSQAPIPSKVVDEDDYLPTKQNTTTFIIPGDIHPNMENKEEEILRLRLLAGKLSADWGSPDFMTPSLARRIRDFQFAQDRRRKKYGDERPWGILGLYDHLSSIRIDVEWAEDAARRRANGEPYQSWADFDESKKGGRNRPYFTYFLLIVCAAVMIASIAVNGWVVEPLSENAMIGPSAETLIIMGAKDTGLIVIQNEGWRLVTSSVLHAGLVHYFINMLALWFVGGAIEMSHGWVASVIIFALSAIGGTILSAIFLPEYITVGASGGIFGFIGACLADIIMNWRLLFSDFVTENGKKHRHAIIVFVLFLDIILNSIIGLTPYVDNYNHLGGMIYGFLCGLSTIERLSAAFFGFDDGFMTRAKHTLSRSIGLILTFVAIITSLVFLLNSDGTTTPCPNCTWLSCIPFPPWDSATEKWWYCDDCGRVTADIIQKPTLHLDLYCPNGATETVELGDGSNYEREELKKKLPSYCREYCPLDS